MGATDFRDLIELGFGSPRSPEKHTTEFYNHFNYTLTFIKIYNIHLYTRLSILSSSVSAETLWCIVLRFATLTSPTLASGVSTVSLAYSRTICRDGLTWLLISNVMTVTLPFFLSVSFNLILWDTGQFEGRLPNADSGVSIRMQTKKFGTEVLSLHFRNY